MTTLERRLASDTAADAAESQIYGVKLRDMSDAEIRAAALWLATQLNNHYAGFLLAPAQERS